MLQLYEAVGLVQPLLAMVEEVVPVRLSPWLVADEPIAVFVHRATVDRHVVHCTTWCDAGINTESEGIDTSK